jgi:predicted NodU family carbamoyl transferase
MIHRQQMGHRTGDILYGLCRALVRNYLSDVAAGKEIQAPLVFQGGVALNGGMVRALREELGREITVPPDCGVTGALGAALLAREAMSGTGASRFKGFGVCGIDYETTSFDCRECPAACEIIQVAVDGEVLARWGGRCEKWEASLVNGV